LRKKGAKNSENSTKNLFYLKKKMTRNLKAICEVKFKPASGIHEIKE
jgi:hypothetical protein